MLGQLLSGCRYRLEVGSEILEGSIGDDGAIETQVLPEVRNAELTLWFDDEDDFEDCGLLLKVGQLDPIDTISGVQGRLNNLGYFCGSEPGKLNPATEAAIRLFQKHYAMEADGLIGDPLRSRLQELFGFCSSSTMAALGALVACRPECSCTT